MKNPATLLVICFAVIEFVSVATAADPVPAAVPSAAAPMGSSETVPATDSGAPGAPISPPRVVDYKKFRDPFKEPLVSEVADLRSDLEKFSVTDFKVSGIITGPLRMRAMIIAPDGKTHYVSEKMKIGLRDGVIRKITTKSLVVLEKVVNPLGEVELFETEIGMDAQTASADGKR